MDGVRGYPIFVLVVEANDLERQILSDYLREQNVWVREAIDSTRALELIKSGPYDAVITGLFLPEFSDGLRLINIASRKFPVVAIGGSVGDGALTEIIRAGASAFLEKPFELNQLLCILPKLMLDRQPMITPSLDSCLSAALGADSTQVPVLIVGETGTGKELLVRTMHQRSPRCLQPLVTITSAIPESLNEVELFGFESRSRVEKVGLVERASKSTLFIDEIADLSTQQQALISRMLREKHFFRVGGSTAVSIDMRLVCSTSRTLANEVERGRFLEALLFQINGLTVTVPPLRCRPADIPLLSNYWLEKFAKRSGHIAVIDGSAMDILVHHPWPGNVRQLFSVLERATLFADTGAGSITINSDHLPPELFSAKP